MSIRYYLDSQFFKITCKRSRTRIFGNPYWLRGALPVSYFSTKDGIFEPIYTDAEQILVRLETNSFSVVCFVDIFTHASIKRKQNAKGVNFVNFSKWDLAYANFVNQFKWAKNKIAQTHKLNAEKGGISSTILNEKKMKSPKHT